MARPRSVTWRAVDFGVLGPLRVVGDDGAEADIGSPTQRIVLATLLARLGQVVPLDVLADAVWEDSPPASAVNTLRSQISRLRRVVGGRLRGLGRRLLARAGAGRRGRRRAVRPTPCGGPRRARRRRRPRRRARGAWRGRAYGELADTPGVRAEARRLELARLDATELVAAADLAAGPVHGGRRGVRGRRRRRRRARAVVGDPRAGARPCRASGRGAARRPAGRRPRCATPGSSPGSTCAAPSARRWRRPPTTPAHGARRPPSSPCRRRR